MEQKGPEIESMLAIDVGITHTRVFLFEAIHTGFQFLGTGVAPTTMQAPVKDIGEGILQAVRSLETLTQRTFIGSDGHFIVPAKSPVSGVDCLAATISAGQDIKVVCAGLLPNVSLESAIHLAASSYTRIVDTISIADPRQQDAQVDAILKLNPDLIIATGGANEGASLSIKKVLETIGLATYLTPPERRCEILFAGNENLSDFVKSYIETLATVSYSANVRPTPDDETLDTAHFALVDAVNRVRFKQITGTSELFNLVGGRLVPTATAFGRMIRFLGRIYAPSRSVLGIDVGTRFTTVAAGKMGRLALHVNQLGSGNDSDLDTMLKIRPMEISQWLPFQAKEEQIQEYLLNKALFPANTPVIQEDLALEQAFSRYRIRAAVAKAGEMYPGFNIWGKDGLLPGFEPIVVAGSAVSNAPSMQQAVLMLLDSLQPIGISTLVLDSNNLMGALGVAGQIVPAIPVNILESGALVNLCTVIAPYSNKRPGTTILLIHLVLDSGEEIDIEVHQGTLMRIPLSHGETARLYLEPLHNTDVGLSRAKKGGSYKVTGGALGLVIDARGRPLRTSHDPDIRAEILKSWAEALVI